MREISVNPLSGVKTFWEWDDAAQEHVFVSQIDQTLTKAVVERNKALEGQGMGKDMRLAASIPPEVQFEWLHKYGVEFWNPDHADGVKRLLNDPDYRYLRVNHFIM